MLPLFLAASSPESIPGTTLVSLQAVVMAATWEVHIHAGGLDPLLFSPDSIAQNHQSSKSYKSCYNCVAMDTFVMQIWSVLGVYRSGNQHVQSFGDCVSSSHMLQFSSLHLKVGKSGAVLLCCWRFSL